MFHTPPYSLHDVSLHDANEFSGKGKLYRMTVGVNGNLIKTELHTKVKMAPNTGCSTMTSGSAVASIEKSECNPTSGGRKSRESIGSPNTLERRRKRYSYTMSKQTSVEVPYARLLDSPSKKVLRQDSAEYSSGGISIVRRSSDSNKSQSNTLQIQSPKTSISDSRLVGEVEIEDDLEVKIVQ